MKTKFSIILSIASMFIIISGIISCSKEGATDVVNEYANTRWTKIYSGSGLSFRLILNNDGSCKATYYEDEMLIKEQFSAIGRYYNVGGKIEFNDNFIVKRIPPLNGQTQYIRLKEAQIKGSSILKVSIDLKTGSASWSYEQIELEKERW